MRCKFLLLFLLVVSTCQFKIGSSRLGNWSIKIDEVGIQPYINDIRDRYNGILSRVGESVEIPNVQCDWQQFGLIATVDVKPDEILCSIPITRCITTGYVEEILFGKSVNLSGDDGELIDLVQGFEEDIYRQSYLVARKTLELLTVKLQDCNELPIHITQNEAKIFILAYGLTIMLYTQQLNNPDMQQYLSADKGHLPIMLGAKVLELAQDKLLTNKVMRYRRCLDELATVPFGVNEFLLRIDRELGLSVYRHSDTFAPKGPIFQDFKTSAQHTLCKLAQLCYPRAISDDRKFGEFKKLLYRVFCTVCRYNVWPNFKCIADPTISDGAAGIGAIADSKTQYSFPLIIPIVGFCNHSSTDSNALISISSFEHGEMCVNLISKGKIGVNEQVLIDYGDYPNHLFYLNYGFIPSYNPHNLVYVEADCDSILKAANDIGHGDKLPSCYPRGLPREKLDLIDQLNIFEKVQEVDWLKFYKTPYYSGVPLVTYQEHVAKFGDKDPLQYYLNPQPALQVATKVNTENFVCDFKSKANRFIWIKPDGQIDSRLLLALKVRLEFFVLYFSEFKLFKLYFDM